MARVAFVLIAGVLLLGIASSAASETVAGSGVFIDARDGQTYEYVTIRAQRWMARNLNYQTGNSWCYDLDASKCLQYGRLYDWNTARRACPAGWHLPSDEEWWALAKDGDEGDKTSGTLLKSSYSWDGTNAFGFSALPGGYRNYDGTFKDLGVIAYFWSSWQLDADYAWYRFLQSDSGALGRFGHYKSDGFSVRCLHD